MDRVPLVVAYEEADSTLGAVRIADLYSGEVGRWDLESDDDIIAAGVADWLLAEDDSELHPAVEPGPIWIGFHVGDFVRRLVVESSLPGASVRRPAPVGWLSHSEFVDFAGLFASPDWAGLQKSRGLSEEWNGPHQDADKDLVAAYRLSAQLGLVQLQV